MNPASLPMPTSELMLKFAKTVNTILYGGLTYQFFFNLIGKNCITSMTNQEAFTFGAFLLAAWLVIFDKIHTYIWTDPKPKAPPIVWNPDELPGTFEL